MELNGTKVLIADDEADILEILSFNLEKNGFTVYTAKDGNDALQTAKQVLPDIIILDVMMPYKTGIEVCEVLRHLSNFKDTPIIMLTALSDENSHIKGLEAGADDYINKPVSGKILISRINALLRRTLRITAENKIIEVGNVKIDATNYLVYIDNKEVVLAKKEFELLFLLASKPGRVFLRNEILNSVWGADVIVGDRTIDVHIRKIRQKLELDCIVTQKGVGYKFVV